MKEETCNCQETDNQDANCTCDNACNCEEKPKKQKKDKNKEAINNLQTKIKELEDNILREKAELINYRKRKEDETVRIMKYANEDLVKDILPVLDNFERAIDMDNDDLTDELSKFLSGFKMIYCHLKEDLEKYGVKTIDGFHKPFDPIYHQAVLTEEKEGIESGMVIEVMQKGYLLKDKVIRPAMVKVSE